MKGKRMKIKTLFTLGVGLGIGFVLGMDTDPKTKDRIHLAVKRKIFWILTGEEMPEGKQKNGFHYCTYQDYSKGQKEDETNG